MLTVCSQTKHVCLKSNDPSFSNILHDIGLYAFMQTNLKLQVLSAFRVKKKYVSQGSVWQAH